jgi:hypothetical protein
MGRVGSVVASLLGVAALATASCAKEREWVDATQAPDVKLDSQPSRCLIETGCLSQPLALPNCSSVPVDGGPTDARVGQRVVLEGYLQIEGMGADRRAVS